MPNTTENITITDLLGRPPGWLLRSGISLVFIIVLAGITLSAFIYYPDKIQASFIIQQASPPVALNAKMTAVLDTLLVKEGDTVTTGQLLGALASSTDWRALLNLDDLLQKNNIEKTTIIPSTKNLGSVQNFHTSWTEAINTFTFFEENNQLKQEQTRLKQEKNIYYELKTNSQRQIKLLAKQLDLEHTDLDRQATLLKEGVISQQEYEQKEKTALQMQQQFENLKASQIQQKLQINTIEKQLAKLKKEHEQKKFNLQQAIQQKTEELKGQLQNWKEQYLLIAPIGGKIVRASDIIIKQQLVAGQYIMTIIPDNPSVPTTLVRLKAPTMGIGKVEPGDVVLLHLDAYPSREYGALTTQITEIHPLPQQTTDGELFYDLTATITYPLKTNYGKEIPVKEILIGTAFVITKNRSVLARIFEQLLDLVNTST